MSKFIDTDFEYLEHYHIHGGLLFRDYIKSKLQELKGVDKE